MQSRKKYTGAELRQEAANELYKEMESLKNRPLTSQEKVKMDRLALFLTRQVLKEMGKYD